MSNLNRSTQDPDELPIDFRVFDEMLRGSSGPEVGIGDFAVGVRVGLGVQRPTCPRLCSKKKKKKKKKWRSEGTAGTTGGRRATHFGPSAGRQGSTNQSVGGTTPVPTPRGCKPWSTPKGEGGTRSYGESVLWW